MKYSELMDDEQPERKFRDLPDYNTLISGGDINVSNYKLTSLSGVPEKVYGNFICWGNNLSTLISGPTEVLGGFACQSNPLTNLVGAPEIVGRHFYCGSIDKTISLTGITTKQICGEFLIYGKITGVLGLFKIRGITNVFFEQMPAVSAIINRYITNGIRGMLACQAELIAAGFKDVL